MRDCIVVCLEREEGYTVVAFPETNDLRHVTPSQMSDWELVSWATRFGGWSYSMLDNELCSPHGVKTRVFNHKNVGQDVREQLVAQIERAKIVQQRRMKDD